MFTNWTSVKNNKQNRIHDLLRDYTRIFRPANQTDRALMSEWAKNNQIKSGLSEPAQEGDAFAGANARGQA